MGSVEVSLSDLRSIANNLFDFLEHTMHVQKIVLEADMYWEVLESEKYNLDATPENLGVGQLYDDLEFLRGCLADKSNAAPANFQHLAAILGYIATHAEFNTSAL